MKKGDFHLGKTLFIDDIVRACWLIWIVNCDGFWGIFVLSGCATFLGGCCFGILLGIRLTSWLSSSTGN